MYSLNIFITFIYLLMHVHSLTYGGQRVTFRSRFLLPLAEAGSFMFSSLLCSPEQLGLEPPWKSVSICHIIMGVWEYRYTPPHLAYMGSGVENWEDQALMSGKKGHWRLQVEKILRCHGQERFALLTNRKDIRQADTSRKGGHRYTHRH